MGRTAIETFGLCKTYDGITAVDNLSFQVYGGEIFGLLGPNGAGKSTTFNIVAGALQPSEGSVRFRGESIVGLASHAIAARGILRTFQHNRPFAGMPVVDNVLVGAHARFTTGLLGTMAGRGRAEEQEKRRRAVELIEFVGLRDWLAADVTTLSFGQGRLLEIARALAGEPQLILLDEPAAGLTPAECERLGGIIREIAERGIAVLLIEHDMRFLLPLAHRVVVLNFGAKIAEGTAEEIRADRNVQSAYLGDPGRAAH